MSARSIRKGKVGEREAANMLRSTAPDLFPEARRTFGQTRRAGAKPDLDIDDEHWPEVKRQQAPSPMAALRQAIAEVKAAGSDRTPIALCRADRDPMGWTVTLRAEDWLELVRAKRDLEAVCARVGLAANEERVIAEFDEVLG